MATACVNDTFLKRRLYRVYWQDGFMKEFQIPDRGVSNWTDPSCHTNGCPCAQGCWPIFYEPFFEESGTSATWVVGTREATINNGSCSNVALTWRHEWYHDCATPISEQIHDQETCELNNLYWNFTNSTCQDTPPVDCVDYICPFRSCGFGMDCCTCQCLPGSPILVDTPVTDSR